MSPSSSSCSLLQGSPPADPTGSALCSFCDEVIAGPDGLGWVCCGGVKGVSLCVAEYYVLVDSVTGQQLGWGG